jgi:CheY-like chemotaxis protein
LVDSRSLVDSEPENPLIFGSPLQYNGDMNFSTKYRILVVDDVSEELVSINQALSASGDFETHGVNHGDAAFEHLETSPRLPDLILLDVNMPGMSGLEVLAGLKMDQRWSEIPVILMTAGAGNDEEQGLEMGACDWVQKPVQPGALAVRMHNQLKILHQKHRAQRIAKETADASSQAIHTVARKLEVNLNQIQDHWKKFSQAFGTEPDICPADMKAEMPVLLHELHADITRMVRITEGLD